jgi:adenylate cyclase
VGERLPRKLAAILYADVAGYSRLTGADEDATHRTLSEYLDLISGSIESHDGRVMHYAGDAVLAMFEAVVDTLSCATDVQHDLKARNEDLPEDRKLQFRIGVNLGDVIEDRGDIYGDGVNVAARLESLADPGGICISDSVRTAVGNKLPLAYEYIGKQQVKNIAEPVRAYRVLSDAIDTQNNSSGSKSLELPDRPSIAVLPFDNMSGDPEQEYFSNGITEDIITQLSQFRSLFVIARNSSFAYKGRAVNVPEIGNDLGVKYVVEGSVRRAGNQVRITAQLIDAVTGNHVWAQRYDRNMEDIFAVQDDVTQKIVAALIGRVEAADLERAKRKSTANMVAYDFLLSGKDHHHRFTREDNAEALKFLDKAIELDPGYAQAFAWRSCTIGQAWVRGYAEDWRAAMRQCIEDARKALELDDNDSECHRILSAIHLLKRQYQQAEYHEERALALNPNDPLIVSQMGEILAFTGNPVEGIQWIEKAMRLDPGRPDLFGNNLGVALHTARRYADAAKALSRISSLRFPHHAYMAACSAELGSVEEARIHASEVLRLKPDFSLEAYIATTPYKNQEDREHLGEGLQKAGLPK